MIVEALRTVPDWEALASRLGCSLPEARAQVRSYLHSRLPPASGTVKAAGFTARIQHDAWGVPHIFGADEPSAYCGLGLAMGLDRFWQMDYLRRLGSGTLAEVLGPGSLANDRLHRTLNLRRTAAEVVRGYEPETRACVDAFCVGVNRAREVLLEQGLPFEFELLDYTPAEWSPVDTETVLRVFWWQLTGRFFFLSVPEHSRRILGSGPLLEALLTPEGDGITIWPQGLPYPPLERWKGRAGAGRLSLDPAETGSNNWAVDAARSTTGQPLLASDPHVPLAMPSVWYEARLRGGSLDVVGAYGAGTPGNFFGRNPDTAWGLTNNISSLRDLYVEVTDDFDPTRYRRGSEWRGSEVRTETILVRDADPVPLRVVEVDHGPVISDLLPAWAATDQVISLRWVGHEPTPELAVMLAYSHARSCAEFQGRLARWACPTFNFVVASRADGIAYQLTGKIPLRAEAVTGYLSGDNADHIWSGYLPYEALPTFSRPAEGWLGTANNPVVGPDWPYPLSGFWPSDHRMRRLQEFLAESHEVSPDRMAAGQFDDLAPRARLWAPVVVRLLRAIGTADPLLEELATWDHRFPADTRAGLVFEAFFAHWAREALGHRLPQAMISDMTMIAAGLVERLLVEDVAGWFGSEQARVTAARRAWQGALDYLLTRLGPDRERWHWGALHRVKVLHPLGDRSDLLRELLDIGPLPNAGTWNTLNNSAWNLTNLFETNSGVSYRLLADLAGTARGVIPGGQSGHPGSPHYRSQFPLWHTGQYHPLELSEPWDGPGWVVE